MECLNQGENIYLFAIFYGEIFQMPLLSRVKLCSRLLLSLVSQPTKLLSPAGQWFFSSSLRDIFKASENLEFILLLLKVALHGCRVQSHTVSPPLFAMQGQPVQFAH